MSYHGFVLGVSASRAGLTDSQKARARERMLEWKIIELNHGDCTGGDEQLHEIAWELREAGLLPHLIIHAWPMIDAAEHAANCRLGPKDVRHAPQPPMARNRVIAKFGDRVMIFPKEFTEQRRGSGTWATKRYATLPGIRKCLVIFPDGSEQWW